MVIAVESEWLPAIRSTTLYRYVMPEATFRLNDAMAGHWVSVETVTPLSVEPVGDLLDAIISSGAELRITPVVVDLWKGVIESTLEFSGTRLRNARDGRRRSASDRAYCMRTTGVAVPQSSSRA
jgi:hypothetical protein